MTFMQRKTVFAGILAFGLLLGAAGCGGGSKTNSDISTIDTGSTGGRVEDVQFQFGASSVFVPSSTSLGISWPSSTPPSQFTVGLTRYKEPLGGESRDASIQKVDVTRSADGSNTWSIHRKDNFDLDLNGVYFLEIGAAGSLPQRSAFITGANRSVAVGEVSRAADVNTGSGGGSLANMTVSPAPGSVYISKSQQFRLSWDNGAVPPATYRVDLRRFKEKRGTDNGGDSSQEVTVAKDNNSANAWIVTRRDNFTLDSNGAYYLEITSGTDRVRAPYIVDPSN